jgi:hypothetical protein
MNNVGGSNMSRQLRRWGPLAIIALVVIVLVVVIAASGGNDGESVDPDEPAVDEPTVDDPTTDDPTTDDPTAIDPLADGVLTWAEAEATGTTADVDWGDRCDTDLGTYAFPFFFAGSCVAPFEGDNGGETSPGVTGDTIKIVVYLAPEIDPVLDYVTGPINNDDTPTDIFDTHQGLVDFYGAYYETYGRTVELVRYDATGPSDDEVAAIADAETIARDLRPFMVWGGPALQLTVFGETLAANEVMCTCGGGITARENYPYLHTISKSAEQSRILLAEYIGKRLAGRNAEHSPDFATEERRFAFLYLETSDVSTTAAENFRDLLNDEYGVELVEMIPYTLNPATLQEQAITRIVTLKDAGVTSIIFAGDPIAPRDFTLAATDQEYFPEWILAGTILVDTNIFARTYDQEQWRHAFGQSNTAVKVDRRKSGFFFLYEWFNGVEPPASDTIGVMWHASLLFPILQGTGPDLTPHSYTDGMLASDSTARGALTQPSISWGDKGLWPDNTLPDLNGIDDVSEIWYDPDTECLDELDNFETGCYWYVGGGNRYLPGQWPDTAPDVFNPDNGVFFYDERPAAETPPAYPSPAG